MVMMIIVVVIMISGSTVVDISNAVVVFLVARVMHFSS